MSAAVLMSASASYGQCGGCTDPCGGSGITVSAGCGAAIPASQSICEPVTSYKVVMEPKYVAESR